MLTSILPRGDDMNPYQLWTVGPLWNVGQKRLVWQLVPKLARLVTLTSASLARLRERWADVKGVWREGDWYMGSKRGRMGLGVLTGVFGNDMGFYGNDIANYSLMARSDSSALLAISSSSSDKTLSLSDNTSLPRQILAACARAVNASDLACAFERVCRR